MLVTSIAPLATDMYVPAFPAVEHDLATSTSLVQLTLTAFFVGMAVGQLIGGPVSDARGQRRPLLVALAVLTAASLACAFAPSLGFMLIARAVQGLSGGLAAVARPVGSVLRQPRFVAFLITFAVSMGVTFAYVATSAFILESMNGLAPIVYSIDFAANAIGLTVATLLAARLAHRVPAQRLIAMGLAATTAAGLMLLIGAIWIGTACGSRSCASSCS